MTETLLPANVTAQERALDLATARLGAVPSPIRELWNADACPADKLAWLAWAFGVDEWDDAWPDEFKRATIKASIGIKRRKGSVWSVRQVLQNAGYGSIDIVEGLYGRTYDGSATHNGFITHGDPTEWAKYRVVLNRPISQAQAAQVRRLLQSNAPARCKLQEFVFTEASNTHNGAITYDGTYTHGTA